MLSTIGDVHKDLVLRSNDTRLSRRTQTHYNNERSTDNFKNKQGTSMQ